MIDPITTICVMLFLILTPPEIKILLFSVVIMHFMPYEVHVLVYLIGFYIWINKL